ncbi:MAG TPA: nucleotide sugar dehydrogenase, partial [Chloroflexota bacterium]|nr:nucleotide sugar dehydrogenase [Chloroflexota bacterium]
MSSLIPDYVSMDSTAQRLAERIVTRRARLVVFGQGYVGVPEAIDLVDAGYSVIGVDIDPSRVAALNAGRSPVPDVPGERIVEAVNRGQYRATTDACVLATADVVI